MGFWFGFFVGWPGGFLGEKKERGGEGRDNKGKKKKIDVLVKIGKKGLMMIFGLES